jgi:hypothetical protein
MTIDWPRLRVASDVEQKVSNVYIKRIAGIVDN